MNKQIRPLIQELAIGAITAITITALLCAFNPAFVLTGISAIAGIAGYNIRSQNRTHNKV